MLKRLLAAAAIAVAPGASATPPSAHFDLNQLGFLPEGAKWAILTDPATQPLAWQVVDERGRVRLSGRTRVYGPDAASGLPVHRIDLSPLHAPGSYRIAALGSASRAFRIDAGLYGRLRYDSLNYFYQTRAGVPILARWAGGAAWARPAGHLPEKATCVSGADARGNVWPGCPYTLDVTGGWYDAGDQGKYVVNGGIAVWTLMDLYERQRARGVPSPYADGRARLPEAGNGVDDLLDEARWELEFLLKMQVPDGTKLRVPVGQKRDAPGLSFEEIDASGMAHHKVADRRWTPLPTPPHLDPEPRLLFPPSTGATLNLAATAAQCARIWRPIDAAFAARCLAASKRAYTAAKRKPQVWAIAEFGGSGGYGDNDLSDEFYWAAAELFATTGEDAYRGDLERSSWYRAAAVPELGWNRVAALGTITLATVANELPAAEVARLRRSIVAASESFLPDIEKNGYGVPFAPERGWPWGSSSSILNRGILLALAHDYTGEARYRDAAVAGMDFILGRNPLDRSLVSGYGARPMENPHHRFWTRQLDPKLPGPPPGVLSGGPNSTAMSDPVAAQMKGSCAPQACWADDARAFALNEVAINWNAPLVWVSAWLAERR